MSKGLRCILCRDVRNTRDGMLNHLTDHSPRALAEELARLAYPPPAPAPTPCGKRSWPTKQAALEVLMRAVRSKSPNRAEKRAYFCTRCAAWHLTKKDERC